MKALFEGYTEVNKPAQFKVPAKTRVIGGVEVVEFYNWIDVNNGDDFIAGNEYNIEVVDGHAVVL
jgi:hypothetical protein